MSQTGRRQSVSLSGGKGGEVGIRRGPGERGSKLAELLAEGTVNPVAQWCLFFFFLRFFRGRVHLKVNPPKTGYPFFPWPLGI